MANTDAPPQRGRSLGRRRALGIVGSVAGLAAAGGSLAALAAQSARAHRWRGIVLGAAASITVVHRDAETARAVVAACRAEIARLERIFSLYRDDSSLTRLNRAGALKAPPGELVALLSLAAKVHRASGRAFDPTVQPLWRLYGEHFARAKADPAGPGMKEIAAARALVGFEAVSIASNRIAFKWSGMALTLNGIAQGFIADRVVAVMKAQGVTDTLIDMGELRALGRHESGRPWRAGIADPRRPGQTVSVLELRNGALATSGDYGTNFDAAGRFTHILDPRSGRPARHHRSVSVTAGSAALADALSTAMFAMPARDGLSMLAGFPGARALIVARDGNVSGWS